MLCVLIIQLICEGWVIIIKVWVKVFCDEVECMIILVKDGSFVFCCWVMGYIYDKQLVYVLFDKVFNCYSDCKGGYICIICIVFCCGDNVEMVIIELV